MFSALSLVWVYFGFPFPAKCDSFDFSRMALNLNDEAVDLASRRRRRFVKPLLSRIRVSRTYREMRANNCGDVGGHLCVQIRAGISSRGVFGLIPKSAAPGLIGLDDEQKDIDKAVSFLHVILIIIKYYQEIIRI